jgi:hypothetical protein
MKDMQLHLHLATSQVKSRSCMKSNDNECGTAVEGIIPAFSGSTGVFCGS